MNGGMPKNSVNCCLRLKTITILVILGFALTVLGIVLRPIIDQIFRKKIDEHLVLSPDSATFKPWHKTTIPVYSKYYFFDILNPDEVRQGTKPFVEERGPYTYVAHTEKINITWNDNATVTYDEKTWYVFDPNLSCASCNPFTNELTTVNIALITVAEMMKSYPDYFHWKLIVSDLLKRFSESLFITRKVQDLLWGYEDPLLNEVEKLRQEMPSILKSLIPKVDATVLLVPNDTLQGTTTIYTGAKNIRNLEKWQSWKGRDNLDIWLTNFANMINGTDGRQFAPKVTEADTIYFFVIQLCRSLYITYDHQLQDQDIDVYRFVTPLELFQNGTVNPDNEAFYPHGFLPTGILDPRECQGGKVLAPIFISAPHFYLGDPRLLEAVEGLKPPDKEKHELSFDIEPNLGVPLTNAIRLQVNAFIEPVQDISETSGVRKVYMPIMWFEESASLDSDTTAMFRNDILIPMKICHYVEIAIICTGSFLLLLEFIVIFCIICKKKKRILFSNSMEERQPLIIDNNYVDAK